MTQTDMVTFTCAQCGETFILTNEVCVDTGDTVQICESCYDELLMESGLDATE